MLRFFIRSVILLKIAILALKMDLSVMGSLLNEAFILKLWITYSKPIFDKAV